MTDVLAPQESKDEMAQIDDQALLHDALGFLIQLVHSDPAADNDDNPAEGDILLVRGQASRFAQKALSEIEATCGTLPESALIDALQCLHDAEKKMADGFLFERADFAAWVHVLRSQIQH